MAKFIDVTLVNEAGGSTVVYLNTDRIVYVTEHLDCDATLNGTCDIYLSDERVLNVFHTPEFVMSLINANNTFSGFGNL